MTDLESTLPMLQRNIELNEDQWKTGGGTACAKVLEWGNEIPLYLSCDIIVLADCVYYTEVHALLDYHNTNFDYTQKKFHWPVSCSLTRNNGPLFNHNEKYYFTFQSIKPLLKTLQLLCEGNPEAYAILSQEERDTPGQIPVWKEFLSELSKKFKIERVPLSEQHPTYSSEDIHLMKLTALR